MNISFDWLKEYVDIDVTPAELAERLTLLGFEVDDVKKIGPSVSDEIVVGHVLTVKPHPNADRLVVCDVDLGGQESVQIVCGAPNVAAGQFVPVATPGTTVELPDREDSSKRVSVTLRKSKIRGEISNGMICAEDELGLSNDHSGIMVLEPDATIGEPLTAYLDRRSSFDYVFDIELTPNRPDGTCHLGIAREVAAHYNQSLQLPTIGDHLKLGHQSVAIEIENSAACGRYVGILVRGIEIGPSPDWMVRRLEAIGLRPRNNVVDITNYVMFEMGQPLHAFDYDQLSEGRIVVRNAADGLAFTTLDDVERRLDGDMLMICDGSKEVAIAGVMGGENSEVSDSTVNVLIESAWFAPSSIRRTARTLGLQTDASYRFERGVDPGITLEAATRAAELMVELAGGKIEEVLDVHPEPQGRRTVQLRPNRVGRILGIEIDTPTIRGLLEGIDIQTSVDGEVLQCSVPTFRPDIEREIDLIEEVARRFGFENIPPPSGTTIPYSAYEPDPVSEMRSKTLQTLSGLGFREIYTNSLVSPATAEQYANLLDPAGEAVSTHNAISHEMSALRSSLLPGGLQIVAHNVRHGFRDVRFVEFGHVFHRGSGAEDTRPSWVDGYVERESIILMLSGSIEKRAFDRPARTADLFDLKGIVDALATSLGVSSLDYTDIESDGDIAANLLRISTQGDAVGMLGTVSETSLSHFDIDQPVYFAELEWPRIVRAGLSQKTSTYQAVSRYPAIERDLAIVVGTETPAASVVNVIKEAGGPLLSAVDVFDVFTGDEVGVGKKSIAVSLVFRTDRTLVDKEIDARINRIVKALAKTCDAHLRQ